MTDTIRVGVVEFGDRKFLQLQWRDPDTGKLKTQSSKKTVKRDAEREAAKLEDKLAKGTFRRSTRTTWDDFWQRYDDEVLTGLANKTAHKALTVRNVVKKILNPERITEVTTSRLSYLQAELRKRNCTDSTIDGYLAHLRAAFQWGVKVGVLLQVPEIIRPPRVKGRSMSKGRPITGEEFDRMLACVPAIVAPVPKKALTERKAAARELRDKAAIASWRHYLRGLWWSGLRLGESLELYWDRDDRHSVDLSGKRPMLRIIAELEKGNQDRLLPIAPEFYEFLMATPEAERTGRVFKPMRRCHEGERLSDDVVTRTISEIGKKAGVKVWTHPLTAKVKYATAHDLRRSFGYRWASRVMPAMLQQMMRHESIDTTMQFYVGRNAEATADTVWEAFRLATNTFTNTAPKTDEIPAET